MRLKPNPLRLNALSFTVSRVAPTLSERVRELLRTEARSRGLSHRDIAGVLGGTAAGWSPSRVTKNLTGRVEMGVDELEALCFALSISITEVVRDRGLEFCAEMTPTELRVLERLRQVPKPVMEAILTILDVRASSSQIEPRGATPRRKILGKARNVRATSM
jgi:transcriptional regulator with XRE-family HTH domain